MAFKGKSFKDHYESERTFEREPTYWEELDKGGFTLRLQDFTAGSKVQVRFVGGIHPMRRHWCKTTTNKNFPVTCTRFDPETDKFVPKGKYDCLACFFENRNKKASTDDEKRAVGGASKAHLINLINRSLQADGHENPIQIVNIGGDHDKDIKAAIATQDVPPNDDNDGYDMVYTFSKNEKGKVGSKLAAKISRDGQGRTLTEAEAAYTLIDLEAVYQSTLPKRREEIVSYFHNGQIKSIDEAQEIADWSVQAGLMTEEDVASAMRAIDTIQGKRENYAGGTTNSGSNIPKEEVPTEEAMQKPVQRASTPPAPKATTPAPVRQQPDEPVEEVETPVAAAAAPSPPQQKKTLVPPPPKRNL